MVTRTTIERRGDRWEVVQYDLHAGNLEDTAREPAMCRSEDAHILHIGEPIRYTVYHDDEGAQRVFVEVSMPTGNTETALFEGQHALITLVRIGKFPTIRP